MIADSEGDIGVTFFSENPLADAFYRFRRNESKPGFHTAPHGKSVSGDKDTGLTPITNVWDQFRIQVEVERRRRYMTSVSPARLSTGNIGVWSMSSGNKYWDDLAVVSLLPYKGRETIYEPIALSKTFLNDFRQSLQRINA